MNAIILENWHVLHFGFNSTSGKSHILSVYCYKFVSDSGKSDKTKSYAGKSHRGEIILINKNATAHVY